MIGSYWDPRGPHQIARDAERELRRRDRECAALSETQAAEAPLECLLEVRDRLLENPTRIGVIKLEILRKEIRRRERRGEVPGKTTVEQWAASIAARKDPPA